jgi:uncharacterized protein (DUF927 family)
MMHCCCCPTGKLLYQFKQFAVMMKVNKVHHRFAVRSVSYQQLLIVSVTRPADSTSLNTTHSRMPLAWSTAVNVSSEDPLQHVLSKHLAPDICYLCGEDN